MGKRFEQNEILGTVYVGRYNSAALLIWTALKTYLVRCNLNVIKALNSLTRHQLISDEMVKDLMNERERSW